MKKNCSLLTDEDGSVTLLVLMILTLLVVIGASGVTTANIEKSSAKNETLYKLAFFSGEAARAYVSTNPNLYGVDNVDTTAQPHLFPNNSDPYLPITAGPVASFDMGNGQSFSGTVEYDGGITPPRGSGYDTSGYRAHQYMMACGGTGPQDVSVQIEAGFYRIGF